MEIQVHNASENNLKNISVSIPVGKITGITGVSGSGKSTLLKKVIAAYGARNFTYISTKTVKNALKISDFIQVDEIENLPQTILIDIKSSIHNPMSTVSTVSGIHEILRNLFCDFGESHCLICGNEIIHTFAEDTIFVADLEYNELYNQAIEYINFNGNVIEESFFDRDGELTSVNRKKSLVTILFSMNNVTHKKIHEFNSAYQCRLHIKSIYIRDIYDAVREMECSECHRISPVITRSRFSFNTPYDDGGGACRCCNGTGHVAELNADSIILDYSKGIFDGGLNFVSDKGIKYTTVTEKFLSAVYEYLDLDIYMHIEDITKEKFDVLLFGTKEKVTFTDRIGGKKNLIFQGIVNYLREAYLQGKGTKTLTNILIKRICPECLGTRIDQGIYCFTLNKRTLSSLLNMTLDKFNEWVTDAQSHMPETAQIYFERLSRKLADFNKVSCGHLVLSRSSNTLSGGELQRIRMCSLLNSNVNGICYLLDEPSSGLHYFDIQKLGNLFKEVCAQGNTIIMVEHNRKLLQFCDYIVDMGPLGGSKGGTVLFSDYSSVLEKYNTPTAKLLTGRLTASEHSSEVEAKKVRNQEYLEFVDLTYNNLKNVSVKIPKNSFTTICGISGSGKSTFVKQAIYNIISKNPSEYGFKGIEFLSQDSRGTSVLSTVGTILKLTDYISKAFEKNSRLSKRCFMPNSSEGKCPRCSGKGYILSEANEVLGMCDHCQGQGYAANTLEIKWEGLNIYDIYNLPLAEMKEKISDKKVNTIAEMSDLLGVGYLSLARMTKFLSKGELQRVSLISVLVDGEKNKIILLDEPSKGMHTVDAEKLVSALRTVAANNNTVIVVEHNPELIRDSDYMVEFGGTGNQGGYLLYSGAPCHVSGTPTAAMLESFDSVFGEVERESDRDIIVSDDNNEMIFKPHAFYKDTENNDLLIQAGKKSLEEYLAAAIPNNIFFSKSRGGNIMMRMPIVRIVDFKETSRYNLSVASAMGISSLITSWLLNTYTYSRQIIRYVFDEISPTGKCTSCGGSGKVHEVTEDYFIEDGNLSKACRRFLKNSTSFPEYKKAMKKVTGIDIDIDVVNMTEEERLLLFWGSDILFDVNGKQDRWKGVIPSFIQHYKYYPDDNALRVFKEKKQVLCPVCQGKRLQKKYADITCYGLTYNQWMSLPVIQIAKGIKKQGIHTNVEKKISFILDALIEFGLGNLQLAHELIRLNGIEVGKIKFLSIYFNRICDTGIILVNANLLDKKDTAFVKRFSDKLTENTTVWLLEDMK